MRFSGLLFLALLPSCGSGHSTVTAPQTPASSEPTGRRAGVLPEPTDEDLGRGPLVRLLDEGSAPRRRVKIVPAAAQTVTLDSEAKTLGQTTLPYSQKVPIGGTDRGRIVVQPEKDHVVRCTVDTGGEPMKECSFQRSERGGITKISMLTLEATGDDDLGGDGFVRHGAHPIVFRAAVRFVSAPFPTDEIGVGARWEVWERVRVDHVWTRRHARYTVAMLSESGAVLDLVLDETAGEQTIDSFEEMREQAVAELVKMKAQIPPGLLDGNLTLSPQVQEAMAQMRAAQPKLRSAKQHVEGKLEISFDKPLARNATLTSEATYSVEYAKFGEEGTVTRKISLRETQ
jgi:hypothetical protein